MDTVSLLHVAVVQADIAWCDPLANRRALERVLDDVPQADLVVLPEMFTTGFCMEPSLAAEPDGGDTLDWMRQVCRSRDCAMAGSVAVNDGGRYYNRAYFVCPDGGTEVYDKRHLFTYGGEGRAYSPGSRRVVAEWRGWRFLLQVCYDLRFPVFARNRGDYDAILYMANWPDSRIAVWDALLVARAIENQCYVVGANRIGDDPAVHYPGHSGVTDAYGRSLASAGAGQPAVLLATLDREALLRFRRKFPVLDDADAFGLQP